MMIYVKLLFKGNSHLLLVLGLCSDSAVAALPEHTVLKACEPGKVADRQIFLPDDFADIGVEVAYRIAGENDEEHHQRCQDQECRRGKKIYFRTCLSDWAFDC